MTIASVGTVSTVDSPPSSGTATGAAKGGGASADANSSASTTVVSKITIENPDGSTTTITTYADGHTETETAPPKSGSQPASSAGAAGGGEGRVTSVNLLV